MLTAPSETQRQVVADMFETNVACALCIVPCANIPALTDVVSCVLACQHQIENRCENTTRVAHLIANATCGGRDTMVRMLSLSEAVCVYCMLETYESVCGAGYVSRVLHLGTDYPIFPRACLPELANVLESAQATAVRAALASRSVYGLTIVARPAVTDVYVATEERIHASPVYRGLHHATYMFRCNPGPAGETWAISTRADPSSWDRCEADLWIGLATAQARDDAADLAKQVGTVHFDLSLARCAVDDLLGAFASFSLDSEAMVDRRSVSFPDDATPSRIACSLAMLFGPHNVDSRTSSVVVQLPSTVGEVELVSDVVVLENENLRLESSGQVTLRLSACGFRVQRGGRLELHGLTIANTLAGSAVFSLGAVQLSNCTFARCVTGANFIARFAEGLVPRGDGIEAPLRGAFLLAF